MAKKIPLILERRAKISKKVAADGTPDRYDISFSSETPYERWFGTEILVHTKDAVDMSRAAGGMPFLLNHGVDKVLGRVENFRLEGKQTRGEVVFDEEDPEALKYKSKVDREFLGDVSLQYRVDEDSVEITRTKGEPDTVRFLKWTPVEGSLATIAADPSVGFGRTFNPEDPTMADEDNGVIDIQQFRTEVSTAKSQGTAEGAKAERQRAAAINDAFDTLNRQYQTDIFKALRKRCIADNCTIEQTRTAILGLINTEPGADPGVGAGDGDGAVAHAPMHDQHSRTIHAGQDEMEKFQQGVSEALEFRMRVDTSEELRKKMGANPFSGMRLVEIGRHYLRMLGINAGALAPATVAKMSLQRTGIIAHSTSDYTAVLANIVNKMLGKGYMQNAETWRPLVTIVNLPDYKEGSIPSLTSFTDLLEVGENAEYKSGTLGEVAEPIKMRKFGRKYSISREAILNDDLMAFTRIPRLMGLAAARKVGDLFWNDIIIDNPVLKQDNQMLFGNFHANQSNNNDPLAVAGLNTAIAKMRTQKDPDKRATLNVVPAYLMVPAALEGTADVLTTAMYQTGNMTSTTDAQLEKDGNNRFTNLTPIIEPRLDADDPGCWYLSSDPNSGVVDSVAIAFLNGEEQPFMEQQEGFDQDGVMYKIRLEATAAAIAYQGLQRIGKIAG